MEGLIFIIALVVLFLLLHWRKSKDRELDKEIDRTKTLSLSDLKKLNYVHLQNILRQTSSSFRDPRPGAVILDYKSKGYEVALCTCAYDQWGRDISDECYSLWGRYKLHLVRNRA